MTKEESLRLEQILKKIDEADEADDRKDEEYNRFCLRMRENWNEEKYQKLKREKALTEAAYFATHLTLPQSIVLHCLLRNGSATFWRLLHPHQR